MGSSQVKPGATYKLTQLHTGRQVKEIKAMVFILFRHGISIFDPTSRM